MGLGDLLRKKKNWNPSSGARSLRRSEDATEMGKITKMPKFEHSIAAEENKNEDLQTPGAAKLFRKSVDKLRKSGQYSSSNPDSKSAKMVRESSKKPLSEVE